MVSRGNQKSGRRWVQCAAILACCVPAVLPVHAQNYPVKPVRIVIGYGPGGAADFTARLIGQKLQLPEHLGQPFIVETRPGAGSTLGIARVASAPADGYTLLLIAEGGLAQSARGAKLPYDLLRDLAPITHVAAGPYGLSVHPAVPARNVSELIALARKMPGKLTFGSSGTGGAQHIAGELLNMLAGVKTMHVPYKGGAQSAVAVAGGEIDMAFTTIPSAQALINSGRLRLIAISMDRRVSFLPDIPTLHESGLKGYDYSAWYGILAPTGTPREIINRLHGAIGAVVKTAESKELLNKGGLEPRTSTPEEFTQFMRNQMERSAKLFRFAGIKAE